MTGGATGLTLPLRGGFAHAPYYLALALAVASFGIVWWIRRSRLGLGLACIREDIEAADSIGIRSGWPAAPDLDDQRWRSSAGRRRLRRLPFYVEPGDVFGFNRSIGLILMTIIGGVNSLWGPVVGALLFLALEQVLAASFPNLHLGIYGLLLIVIMLASSPGARRTRPTAASGGQHQDPAGLRGLRR